ncbi:MAG: hypothetical protein R3B13_17595 [Polyangiaceae bacterium]
MNASFASNLSQFRAPLSALVGGALLAASLLACSGPAENDRFGMLTPPRDQFAPASEMLGAHCGSLDCHGQPGRNLRLYHFNGLRLDEVSGAGVTSNAEHEANFQSVILLEPEAMFDLVKGGGRNPELLSIVRKARGTEAHKGGKRWTPGDAADTCFATWLAGAINLDACAAAEEVPRPDFP